MKRNSYSESGFFALRIFLGVAFLLTASFFVLLGVAGPNPIQPLPNNVLVSAVIPVISPALRDLPTTSQIVTTETDLGDTGRQLTGRQLSNPGVRDPVVQTAAPTAAMPPVGVSFEGMNIQQGCGNCQPPDTDGAVGPNHYVQMVNTELAVFDKTTGAMISGPTPIRNLWASGECSVRDDGDPIVLYDQLADRWVISQFTSAAAPAYAECIAVSTSPDPTGTYYAYEFDESTTVFHDYPKLAVWPDAYYMTSNEFPSGQETNSGAGAFAFERAKMLAGQPARFVWFDESAIAVGAVAYVPGGQNPTNLDGKVPPPAGMPNYIVEVDTPPSTPDPQTSSVLVMFKFHVDWNNPANSTFGTGSTTPVPVGGGLYQANGGHPDFEVPIADFVPAQCVYGNGPNCVPQKLNPPQPPLFLDTLGDRTMFRVTYRNFGDHESMVVHHSVVTNADTQDGLTRIGLRWYEVRNLSTTPTIYQQSTFAPLDQSNPLWRWMGSAAMDHMGDIAIGYSASGPNYFASLHYAGRLASDPLNELSQGEAVMFAGTGNQVGSPENRWGDYSDLTVDPNDDCTFWYTQEYSPANNLILGASWHTRIGSFKFPQCSVTPPSLVSMVSRKVHSTTPYDVNLPLTGNPGIEPRSGGANGNYTIVFHFANPVLTCGTTPSTNVGTASIDPASGGNDCVVDLSGITTPRRVTITLNGVIDNQGNQGDVPGATVGILPGDTNGDGTVNSADIGQTKAQSGQVTTSSNFREDVNEDGVINSADIGLVKSKSGTFLP